MFYNDYKSKWGHLLEDIPDSVDIIANNNKVTLDCIVKGDNNKTFKFTIAVPNPQMGLEDLIKTLEDSLKAEAAKALKADTTNVTAEAVTAWLADFNFSGTVPTAIVNTKIDPPIIKAGPAVTGIFAKAKTVLAASVPAPELALKPDTTVGSFILEWNSKTIPQAAGGKPAQPANAPTPAVATPAA